MAEIDIWTDGSCWPSSGPGAWACIIIWGDKRKVLCEATAETTISRMELLGVINGLRALKGGPHDIVIHTDSQYVQKAITGIQKVRANHDLIAELTSLVNKHHCIVSWDHGHIGIAENELCDKLAGAARLALYGPQPAKKG